MSHKMPRETLSKMKLNTFEINPSTRSLRSRALPPSISQFLLFDFFPFDSFFDFFFSQSLLIILSYVDRVVPVLLL